MALGKGEAARILINQRGIDVSVSMTTPESRTLTIDGFERGYESVTLLTENRGTFALEIRQTPSASLAGNYEIWLTQLRLQTPQDAVRAKAERETTEGRVLAGAGDERDKKTEMAANNQRRIRIPG